MIHRPTALPIDPAGTLDSGFDRARVTSPFGWRRNPLDPAAAPIFHDGLDIGNARLGDELIADAAGTVVVASAPGWPWSEPTTRFASGNYGGTMVVIEHAGEWCSVYAHMNPKLAVQVGQFVKVGDRVGVIGASGAAEIGGGHLHYGHVMRPAAAVVAAGRVRAEWVRDPWPVIDPIGALVVGESPAERLARLRAEAIARRAEQPRARRAWEAATRLVQDADGKPLRTVDRLAAELLYLRTDPLHERNAP